MASYYDDADLERYGQVADGNPELFESFLAWYSQAVGGDGALSKREKALIGLAVAHVCQCPYCIDSLSTKCLESGADLAQMTEAIHVAGALKAGSCLAHAIQMRSKHDSVSM